MTELILLLSLQDGLSALMLASLNRHTENAKYLVDSKAAIDLQTQTKYQMLNLILLELESHDKVILYMIIKHI